MAGNKKVTVGSNAYSFHDQSTGITVVKGEVKELTPRQLKAKRIHTALATGHLVYVAEEVQVKKISESEVEKLTTKLIGQFEKGMELTKIAKSYTREQMVLIAEKFDVEADEKDTVETILETLLQEYEESKTKKK